MHRSGRSSVRLVLIVGCLNLVLASDHRGQQELGNNQVESLINVKSLSSWSSAPIKNPTTKTREAAALNELKSNHSTDSPGRLRRHLATEAATTTASQADLEFEQFIQVAPNVQTSARNNLPAQVLASSTKSASSPAQVPSSTSSVSSTLLETTERPNEANDETDQYTKITNHMKKKNNSKGYLKNRANSAAYISTRQLATPPGNPRNDQNAQVAGPKLAQATPPFTASQSDYLNRIYLDTSNMLLNVKAHLGETAYLLCRLRSGQQQQQQAHELPLQVSWVKNMQILTSGEFRYTSDERFRPTHLAANPQDWLLEIHNVQASDEGQYECQVNSEPKPASITLNLQVISAQVEILEAPETRVEHGDDIRLTCRVEFRSQAQLRRELLDLSQDLEESVDTDVIRGNKRRRRRRLAPSTRSAITNNWQHYLYWYKDGVSLEYNNPRGNVQVQRRDLKPGEEDGLDLGDEASSGLESILRLGRAGGQDQGYYMCKLLPELLDVQPARVRVLVGSTSASSNHASQSGGVSLVTSQLASIVLSYWVFMALRN